VPRNAESLVNEAENDFQARREVKVLPFTIFCILFLGFNFAVQGKESGICMLAVFLKDNRNKVIDNAEIKAFDEEDGFEWRWSIDYHKNLSWSKEKKAYYDGTMSCNRLQTVKIQISAEGFELYEEVVTITRGWNSFAIKLKSKGTNEITSIEQLSNLLGRIENSNKKAIPNAVVFLTNKAGKKLRDVTDEYGIYRFEDIKSGEYKIKIVGTKGFATIKIIKFQVPKGQVYLDAILQPKTKDNSLITEVVCNPSKFIRNRLECELVTKDANKK